MYTAKYFYGEFEQNFSKVLQTRGFGNNSYFGGLVGILLFFTTVRSNLIWNKLIY